MLFILSRIFWVVYKNAGANLFSKDEVQSFNHHLYGTTLRVLESRRAQTLNVI